jgi:bifunctional non-homologous end joining protein LigD
MPGFIKPQLATLRSKAPKGDYLYEIKYGLPRPAPHRWRQAEGVHPNRLNRTERFSVIAGAFDIPGQAIIDGEVVAVHEGRNYGDSALN